MKLLITTLVEAIVGLAVAGVALAVLLPALVEAGYVASGSSTMPWIVGGVIVGCIALVVLRPWKLIYSPPDEQRK